MKITKSRLHKLIKEVLKEGGAQGHYDPSSSEMSSSEDPDSDADDTAELQAGIDLTGFELVKDRGYFFIVDKESGQRVLGPFRSEGQAEERRLDPGLRGDYEAAKKVLDTRAGDYSLKEGGAFASDEEIQAITKAASTVDPDIKSFNEFYEAVRIAWNESAFEYEPSRHEIRQAWKRHPGNMFTHDPRDRYR